MEATRLIPRIANAVRIMKSLCGCVIRIQNLDLQRAILRRSQRQGVLIVLAWSCDELAVRCLESVRLANLLELEVVRFSSSANFLTHRFPVARFARLTVLVSARP